MNYAIALNDVNYEEEIKDPKKYYKKEAVWMDILREALSNSEKWMQYLLIKIKSNSAEDKSSNLNVCAIIIHSKAYIIKSLVEYACCLRNLIIPYVIIKSSRKNAGNLIDELFTDKLSSKVLYYGNRGFSVERLVRMPRYLMLLSKRQYCECADFKLLSAKRFADSALRKVFASRRLWCKHYKSIGSSLKHIDDDDGSYYINLHALASPRLLRCYDDIIVLVDASAAKEITTAIRKCQCWYEVITIKEYQPMIDWISAIRKKRILLQKYLP